MYKGARPRKALSALFGLFEPSNDGDLVDSNYMMKVWFSRSLANGTNAQQLINRFLIKLASSESGSPANGVPQNRASHQINYNIDGNGGQYHELAYQLPNLYNDNPSFLHTIDVSYTNPGNPAPQATRLVRARPVAVIKNIIVTPPEVDSDGRPHEIILPDVASPTGGAARDSGPRRDRSDRDERGDRFCGWLGQHDAKSGAEPDHKPEREEPLLGLHLE